MSLNLDPIPIPWKRVLPMLIAASWFLALAWWHRFVVMDDPWITFQYARNLFLGEGLVFNPGDRLEGYSNLTWVLLMLPALAANVELLGYARLLGIMSGLAMFALLIFRGSGCGLRRGGSAALLLAGCYPLAVWAMGGLETAFVALLVLALLMECARANTADSTRQGIIIGSLLSLLVLSRPEGAMYAVIPLATFPVIDKEKRKAIFLALGIFLMVLLIYTIWRWWYFGTIVANTVQAKVGGNPFATLWRGFTYALAYLGGIPILILVVGGVAAWRCRFVDDKSARSRPLILAALAALGIQVLFVLGVGGDWMPAHRFLVPALAPMVILGAIGMERWLLPFRLGFVGILLLGGLVQAKTEPMLNWCRWSAKESGGELNIEPLRKTGMYIAAISRPDDLLAATEAGVLPYYGELRFLDMLGLVDAYIASLPGSMHEKLDADYVLDRAPKFIVLGITITDEGEEGSWAPDRLLLEHPDFHQQYTEIKRWDRHMAPADYSHLLQGANVLYERKDAPDN
ncbi:MAG: hypothetical protein JJU11_01190 [Candidatus Sumerlaeia bacterium]|nr:hypothetical protein [Candidatus Sumerlaeia bacterium]